MRRIFYIAYKLITVHQNLLAWSPYCAGFSHSVGTDYSQPDTSLSVSVVCRIFYTAYKLISTRYSMLGLGNAPDLLHSVQTDYSPPESPRLVSVLCRIFTQRRN